MDSFTENTTNSNLSESISGRGYNFTNEGFSTKDTLKFAEIIPYSYIHYATFNGSYFEIKYIPKEFANSYEETSIIPSSKRKEIHHKFIDLKLRKLGLTPKNNKVSILNCASGWIALLSITLLILLVTETIAKNYSTADVPFYFTPFIFIANTLSYEMRLFILALITIIGIIFTIYFYFKNSKIIYYS